MTKRMILAFTALSAIVVTPVVGADLRIRLEPSDKQHQRWDWGRQSVDDPSAATVVRLMPMKSGFSKRASFNVYVLNRGANQFDFAPENVAILLPDGTRIPMLNADDLTKQERRREVWQNVFLALSMIGNSMGTAGAGESYGTATIAGPGGVGVVSYSGYNGAAAAAASAAAAEQNAAHAQRLAQAQADNRAAIELVMQRTTVDPGATVGGIVYFDLPAKLRDGKGPIAATFIVQAGADAHVFTGKFFVADKPDPDHPDEQKLLAPAGERTAVTASAETVHQAPSLWRQASYSPGLSLAFVDAATILRIGQTVQFQVRLDYLRDQGSDHYVATREANCDDGFFRDLSISHYLGPQLIKSVSIAGSLNATAPGSVNRQIVETACGTRKFGKAFDSPSEAARLFFASAKH
jgi:hypothetical protein